MDKRGFLNKKYKVIIFDLDGTLIDSLSYHASSFKEMLDEHNIKISYQKIRKTIGIPTPVVLKELKKKYKFKENIECLRKERRQYFFKSIKNKDLVFPGIIRTLKKLQNSYKLAIATGSSRYVLYRSTKPSLRKYFNFISTIDDVKKGKPAPDQFYSVAIKLKVDPQECLVIGDSIYDGLAAKRAKMDFIGVLTGYTKKRELEKYNPIHVLFSVDHLRKIL
jgi:HAD superfamily hydrolase (TIGR01509 family)